MTPGEKILEALESNRTKTRAELKRYTSLTDTQLTIFLAGLLAEKKIKLIPIGEGGLYSFVSADADLTQVNTNYEEEKEYLYLKENLAVPEYNSPRAKELIFLQVLIQEILEDLIIDGSTRTTSALPEKTDRMILRLLNSQGWDLQYRREKKLGIFSK